MDVIQEWIHTTVGSGGFDVLVKEVGHEACNLQCAENLGNEVIITGENSNSATTKTSLGVEIEQGFQAGPAHEVAQVEDMLIQVNPEEEGDKGRVVIPMTILNEWVNGNNYQNSLNFEKDQLVKGDNQGMADLGGGTVISAAGDSEKTLSYVYNGPKGGAKKGKQKKACHNSA
ncbi:uncharacterized protein DS421_20g680010 [Arachis hypogaea]|nr:uncharacterized protein DS421_20g680010 [Arachis hypogaea]